MGLNGTEPRASGAWKKKKYIAYSEEEKSRSLEKFAINHMSRIMRKLVFKVSNQVQHNQVCTVTEKG